MRQLPVTALRCLHQTYFVNMPKKKEIRSFPVEVKTTTASVVTVNKDGTFDIKIHAKPGAKISAVTEISSDGIGVQIAAPPMDGEANAELVKYIASLLGVRKSNVHLQKGSKSRTKTVTVTCQDQTVDDILAKFQQQIEN